MFVCLIATAGSVLVFVTRKMDSETIATSLRQSGYQGMAVSTAAILILFYACPLAGLLHGDMAQGERDDVITAFKKKEFPILVATDVAGIPVHIFYSVVIQASAT